MRATEFKSHVGHRFVTGTELIHGRPVRTYGRGRVCSTAGCETTLSLYNPDPFCSVHSTVEKDLTHPSGSHGAHSGLTRALPRARR